VPSELQSGFTGGVGECRHTTVVLVATAVEYHGGDPCFTGTLGHETPDLGRCGHTRDPIGHASLLRGNGGNRPSGLVVYDLGRDVTGGTKYSQTRSRSSPPDRLADTTVTTLARP
jgi:hypothetical protein